MRPQVTQANLKLASSRRRLIKARLGRERVPRCDACLRRRARLAGHLLELVGHRLSADKDGGADVPDDMDQAHLTQAWLASGDDPKADVAGQYFFHLKRTEPNP